MTLKRIILFFTAMAFIVPASLGICRAEAGAPHKALFFYTPGCHRCAQLKGQLERMAAAVYKGRLAVEYLDVSGIENYKLLVSIQQEKRANDKFIFPVIYLEGNFLNGTVSAKQLEAEVAALVSGPLKVNAVPRGTGARVNLEAYLRNLGPWMVISGGLVDGINPCAFTAIIFFVSFMSLQGYRRAGIIISGMAFMISSFITYCLIGLGIFASLYKAQVFEGLSRILNISIGILSIVLGALSVYDCVKFYRTGTTEGMILQLPKGLKDKIHSSIGGSYRVQRPGASFAAGRNSTGLIFSGLATGFFVSLFEAACTGKMYFPTIAFVIKTASSRVLALKYLLLYNIMFSVPIFVIFIFSVMGVTSEIFAKMVRRHMIKIKVIMAAVFFALGILLLLAYLPGINKAAASETEPVNGSGNNPITETDSDGIPFWDFGDVTEGDTLTHTFALQNQTLQPISIIQINTSCACTTTNISSDVIPPKDVVSLQVKFETNGYAGEKRRFIYVHTNSSRNPIVMFEIKANVIKRPQ